MEPARPRWGLVAIGLLLCAAWIAATLAMPRGPGEFVFLPGNNEWAFFHPIRGITAERFAEYLVRLALAGPGLILVGLGIAPLLDPGWVRRLAPARAAQVASALSLALMAALMFGVFGGRAVTDDELTYAFQADLLARGQLAFDGVGMVVFEPFVIGTPRGFTGKYLFGEPLVQIPGVLVGIPALAHLLLAAAALWCLWHALRRLADEDIAGWTVVLVGISPMFIFLGATGLSHTTAFAAVAAALLGYALVRDGEHDRGARVLGIAVGFCMVVRPQVGVPVGGVLVALAGWELARGRRWGALALLGGWLTPWALSILAYDLYLSGSPLVLPWYLWFYPEHYGFGRVWADLPWLHTPLDALLNFAVMTSRMNAWWLGWPVSLGLVWAWWRTGRATGPAVRVLLAVSVAIVLIEAPYYTIGISGWGPLYHFELILLLAVLGAHAITRASRERPTVVAGLLLAHLALGTVPFLVLEAASTHRMLHQKYAALERRLAEVERPALVLYETGCWDQLGWVRTALPRRDWMPEDPVVTLPRPPAAHLQSYLDAYPGRACTHYRWDAGFQPCAEATEWLEREEVAIDPTCGIARSTADRLGWFELQLLVQEP